MLVWNSQFSWEDGSNKATCGDFGLVSTLPTEEDSDLAPEELLEDPEEHPTDESSEESSGESSDDVLDMVLGSFWLELEI